MLARWLVGGLGSMSSPNPTMQVRIQREEWKRAKQQRITRSTGAGDDAVSDSCMGIDLNTVMLDRRIVALSLADARPKIKKIGLLSAEMLAVAEERPVNTGF